LFTARGGYNLLGQAFDLGGEDFISKSAMSEQLLPRIFAADRISQLIHRLQHSKQLLARNYALLAEHNLIDSLTDLSKRRYLLPRLADALQRVESRGGFCSLLVLGIQNYEDMGTRFGEHVQQELLRGAARRLQQLVRPMDVIARIGPGTFGICTVGSDADECKPNSFR